VGGLPDALRHWQLENGNRACGVRLELPQIVPQLSFLKGRIAAGNGVRQVVRRCFPRLVEQVGGRGRPGIPEPPPDQGAAMFGPRHGHVQQPEILCQLFLLRLSHMFVQHWRTKIDGQSTGIFLVVKDDPFVFGSQG